MPALPRRLPARFAGVVMPFVLAILMTFIVSGISTLKSVGAAPAMPAAWMGAWAVSWLVAFPALLVLLPVVRRIVALIVEPA